jgi:hypothetical protein
VLDLAMEVALGVEPDVLAVLLVVEAQLVGRASSSPPLVVRLLKPVTVAGRAASTRSCCRCCRRQPITSGRSGSPSRKCTTTSSPTRGRRTRRNPCRPRLATRTQHELFWSFFAKPVPVELDLDAAVLVGFDLVAAAPTTTAVCGPAITGLGVMRGER